MKKVNFIVIEKHLYENLRRKFDVIVNMDFVFIRVSENNYQILKNRLYQTPENAQFDWAFCEKLIKEFEDFIAKSL